MEPVGYIDAGDLREVSNGNSRYIHPDNQGRMASLYTADQLAEARRQERERCAKVCDAHTVDDVLVGVGISKNCAAGKSDGEAETERLRTLANSAEKWKGIASAKFGDGRTVQMIKEEARQAAYREVLTEWEKPWWLSGGKSFIDRLRAMIEPSATGGNGENHDT